MSEGRYFWCLRHELVETAEQACAARYTMGPYASEADARQGLDQVRRRNELQDAEDAAWQGGTD